VIVLNGTYGNRPEVPLSRVLGIGLVKERPDTGQNLVDFHLFLFWSLRNLRYFRSRRTRCLANLRLDKGRVLSEN
jgi:hypothetical protein